MDADYTLNDRVSEGQDGPMSADEMRSRSQFNPQGYTQNFTISGSNNGHVNTIRN